MAKVKKLLSLDEETCDRLEKYAKDNHKSVSQAVTDWIWREKVQITEKEESIVNE